MIVLGILIGIAVLYVILLVACVVKCVKKSDKQFRIVDTIFEEDLDLVSRRNQNEQRKT